MAKKVPMVGSGYGLASTSIDVYNSISVGGVQECSKGLNCMPPEIKTPLLYGALAINSIIVDCENVIRDISDPSSYTMHRKLNFI